MEAFGPLHETIKKWESIPTALMQKSVKALLDVLKPEKEKAKKDIAQDKKWRDALKSSIERMEDELEGQ